jgi:purine-binding chemotaxis protein CheW
MTEEAKTVIDGPASSIDWPAIHRRLETARAALERRLAPTNEEKKKVLKMRATVLAVEPMENARRQEQLEIVEFLLAYERYALESSFVREVYPLKELTPLPGAPSFVLGIINVRGRIVSVIDLKKFFDLPEKGLTDLNRVIIVSDGQMEFGLLADAVPGVRRIPLAEIQPPLPTLTGIRLAYLKGVTSQRLVVLDAAKLLTDPRVTEPQGVEC